MKISPKQRAWLVDAAERVGSTFAQAFLGSFGLEGLIALTGGHVDLSALRVAEQAGLAAVLALLKAAVAAKVSGTVSPASFAPEQQPGQALRGAPSGAVTEARIISGTITNDSPTTGTPPSS